MDNIIYSISFFILIYFAILWIGYLMLLIATFHPVIKKYQEASHNTIVQEYEHNPLLPLTIIIPCYNELKRVMNAVSALLNANYKNIHIIIVNDGSTDTTLDLLISHYALEKTEPAFRQQVKTAAIRAYYQSTTIQNFIVIDKDHSPFANSGADCINAGLNVCRTPLFLTVDSDTIVEQSALSQMLFMYLISPHCVAVGGDIYIPDPNHVKQGQLLETNIPSNVVLGVQVCEYLRSFLYGREGWSFFGGALCFPGAFTMLETQAVRDVGGYDAYNFSYDAEIILKLHHEMRKQHYPYSVAYAPSAIAWSEAPKTLKHLWHQRHCWQRGLLRCMALHKQMFFNPAYGKSGLLAFPYYILFEIFGPVVEAVSYITFIIGVFFSAISLTDLLWLLLLAWGYMLSITLSCVVLSVLTYNKYYRKMDIVRIFGLTLIDMVFYRQFRAFCALISSVHYVVNRIKGLAQ